MADEAQEPATTDAPPSADFAEANADLIAELEALDRGEAVTDEPAGDDNTQPAEDEATTETEDDGEPGEAPEEVADAKPAAEPEPEKEPDTDKRLEAIRQAEKRAKDAVAREREQLAQEQAQWKASVEEAKEYAALKERAKYDPGGVLAKLGLGDDDWEVAARDIYLRSPKAQTTPGMREQAQQTLKSRQHTDELSQIRAELQELKAERAKEQQQRATEESYNTYLGEVTKEIGDSTPIVKNLLANNPTKARAQLRAAADQLSAELGEVPEPAEVAKRLEKIRRAELAEAGVDVAAMFAAKKTKPESQPADEKTTAKTLSDDVRTTTTPPKSEPKTIEELDAEILRELQSGNFD